MRLGIMQPYFFPYIGYFQLITAVDIFIVYDNIKYTKKSWINRNRMLLNGSDAVFSLPLKNDSDTLDVVQRELAIDFDRTKLLNQFKGAYSRAPHFSKTFQLLECIVLFDDTNLFRYIYNSLVKLCRHLDINTEIRISSKIPIDHDLKGREKVIALCQACEASTYINMIGGANLYDGEDFRVYDINLQFIRAKSITYSQFGPSFIPSLSIIDLLMFNEVNIVKEYLTQFELAPGAIKND